MRFARPFQRFVARTHKRRSKNCPGNRFGREWESEVALSGKARRRFDMTKESLVGVACGRFFVLMGMSRLAARAMVECQYVLCMV